MSVKQKSDKMPPGVPFIIGNETAERFSFYGMNTILMVYMSGQMYLNMPENEAAEYIHLFKSAVYMFPLAGALLADVFFGKYRVMFWLSLVYCLGHLALALPGVCFGGDLRLALFSGLALIALGSGGIKSCTSAIVGDQFTSENQHLINKVYNWFYLAINFGSFFSTLLTPWLLKRHGPEWAFGVPGVLMGVATLTLWLGRKRYRIAKPAGFQVLRDFCTRECWATLAKVSAVFLFLILFWAIYDQNTTLWVAQAQKMDPKIFAWCAFLPASCRAWEVIPSQIQALNPFLILTLIPIFTLWLYPKWDRRWGGSPLKKIAVGLFLVVVAQCFPLGFEMASERGFVLNIALQIPAYIVLTTAEVMVSVTSLEFAYTQAPKSIKTLIMGVYLLTMTLGNLVVAQVNRLCLAYPDFLTGAGYYRFFLLLALGNALLFLIVARFYKERVYLQE